MNHKLCVLHAALQFSAFTVEQIVARTGMTKASVERALQEAGDWVEELPQPRGVAQAEQPERMRVRASATAHIAREIAEARRVRDEAEYERIREAVRRVVTALDAAESSIARMAAHPASTAQAIRWERAALAQVALARSLLRLVRPAAIGVDLAARLEMLVSRLDVCIERAPASQDAPVQRGGPHRARVITRYPNRRLYDTLAGLFLNLADVRKLVVDRAHFVIIDKRSQEDMTRRVLLQVIARLEATAEPVMSGDFLSQLIRLHEEAPRDAFGGYLEQSLTLFLGQQREELN